MFTKNEKFEHNQEEESILEEISESEDTNGGTTWACVAVSTVVEASISLCPTTKCTSKCS
ncbi:class II lanthipeptide, LchA2/BrtA2 family [Enterococcus gallinarum]|uniref:class II lanthipeptide, LchA2/BrtA2 family n=1 Tax=Enterococcus gallinarum TaxID=1353 RepID=UPI0018AA310F|nr:class II lanthipeptide, LchA2/BrtA2 family [Enterococcus gallinarum]MCR1928445.1 class II lanthipeptide, LchA2/BrtA2 family [Enterococcus gallinarum]MCR1945449.1 class II lanthipeptide, LchA2/BrtA2 family [Enterococcus gallinarum]